MPFKSADPVLLLLPQPLLQLGRVGAPAMCGQRRGNARAAFRAVARRRVGVPRGRIGYRKPGPSNGRRRRMEIALKSDPLNAHYGELEAASRALL